MEIVFVCTGNTCRSPMAEGILKSKLEGKNIKVSSAGIFAIDGSPVSYNAIEALKDRGIDILDYKSSNINSMDLTSFDLILTMTKSHKEWLLQKYKNLKNANVIYTLKEFNHDREELDIMDPFGGNLEDYRKCADEIEKNIDRLILFLDTSI